MAGQLGELLAADVELIGSALSDAIALKEQEAEPCADCAGSAEGACWRHAGAAAQVAAYWSLAERLGVAIV